MLANPVLVVLIMSGSDDDNMVRNSGGLAQLRCWRKELLALKDQGFLASISGVR